MVACLPVWTSRPVNPGALYQVKLPVGRWLLVGAANDREAIGFALEHWRDWDRRLYPRYPHGSVS